MSLVDSIYFILELKLDILYQNNYESEGYFNELEGLNFPSRNAYSHYRSLDIQQKQSYISIASLCKPVDLSYVASSLNLKDLGVRILTGMFSWWAVDRWMLMMQVAPQSGGFVQMKWKLTILSTNFDNERYQ